MNKDFTYVMKKTSDNMLNTELKNLIPIIVYAACLVIMLVGSIFFTENMAMIMLFKVIGLMTCVWVFSMVVLNRYMIYEKGTVLKVHYVSIFYRMLPMIFYQTIMFSLFVVLNVSVTALFIDRFMLEPFTLIYYLVLGMVIVIPFTLFYVSVNIRRVNIVNTVVLILLILVVPILYFPQQLPDLIRNILALNPFYYIVYSMQLNTIGNPWTINRIPNDILFWAQIAIIYVWLYSIYDKMKYSIYFKYMKRGQSIG